MDNEEIIRMAREAGFAPNSSYTVLPMKDYASNGVSYELERFYQMTFAAGAAHEREACAKVCEQIERRKWEILTQGGKLEGLSPRDCAAAIRARSEK